MELISFSLLASSFIFVEMTSGAALYYLLLGLVNYSICMFGRAHLQYLIVFFKFIYIESKQYSEVVIM